MIVVDVDGIGGCVVWMMMIEWIVLPIIPGRRHYLIGPMRLQWQMFGFHGVFIVGPCPHRRSDVLQREWYGIEDWSVVVVVVFGRWIAKGSNVVVVPLLLWMANSISGLIRSSSSKFGVGGHSDLNGIFDPLQGPYPIRCIDESMDQVGIVVVG